MNSTIKLSLITTLFLSTNLIADEKLEDILVTSATKSTQKLEDITSNVNIITAQEIEERHYTTVTEALNSLSGVSFTRNGGLGKSTSLRLRGFDSDRTIVLIDGIRQNDLTGTSGAPLGDLIINEIQQVEVIKGAQSGIWGADATAGVINIITKKAPKGIHGYASQEFGQFNTSNNKLGLSYSNDTFYTKVSQTRLDSNGFTSKVPKGKDINQFEDDGYKNKTTTLKAGLNINATNKIDISHTIIDATNQYDTNVYDGIYPNSVLNPIKSANSIIDSTTKDTFSSINFNHIDSFNELNLYAKKSTFSRDYPLGSTKAFDGSVKEYGLTSKISYLSDSFILIGGDYKKFEHTNTPLPAIYPAPSPIEKKTYTNKALFITNNNQFQNFIGKTILTESIRYDKYNTFNNKTTGKVGLLQTFQDLNGLQFTTNYGTAYNVPTPYESFGKYSPMNQDLQPDSTKSFDISLAYQGFNATYFNNKIKNMKTFNSATFKYDNLDGTSTIKGYELSYATTIFDVLATNISYTKTNARDNADFSLERRPDKSIKIGLDYYGIEDVHLGLNGEYVGDRIQYAYGTHDVNAQTGNYTVANFVANYEVDQHLSLYGKVDNITDKDYQTVDGYSTSPRAVYAGMKLTY